MENQRELAITLTARCPHCDRAIRLPVNRVATAVVRRTCRGCGAHWQVIVHVIRGEGMVQIRQVDFTELNVDF